VSDGVVGRSTTVDRRWARAGIGLGWGVLMVVLLAAAIFGGMLLGAWLGFDVLPHYNGGHDVAWLLAVGALAGVVVGLTIGHKGRGWVQAWRLHRLRRGGGVTLTASVRRSDGNYVRNPRGGGVTVYDVRVGWRDHQAGEQERERQYKFWGRGAPAFEELVHSGAEVPVVYPPGRPDRFIVDIPFAPTMADQFL
jgi:hypothetical protein